ncbi:hypothetical protein [Spiroplasma endosymbiont of Seladonia tumulorum]|uniref:hypothetical protein n=1 Tax=Spiroplasma endosymbiont of Seladonia tumulorum TaxID=3066321 RepID=UPI0030CBCA79
MKHLKKLAEKDKKIDQQQLYKEDFYKNPYLTGSIDWILVDSSKYDKLPSKEGK